LIHLTLGADHVIVYKSQDLNAEVSRITGGNGVQVVFDGVGKTTFDASLAALARFGTMISFGTFN
jgi:NADPH:quinone reductase